jgi:hypothetical protein
MVGKISVAVVSASRGIADPRGSRGVKSNLRACDMLRLVKHGVNSLALCYRPSLLRSKRSPLSALCAEARPGFWGSGRRLSRGLGLFIAIIPSASNELTGKRMRTNNEGTCQPSFCL